jgi:hypothetical protein
LQYKALVFLPAERLHLSLFDIHWTEKCQLLFF